MMFFRTEIVRANPDNALEQQVWVFTMVDSDLTVDHYARQTKESTRHRKWISGDEYSRLNPSRYCTLIKEEEVPMPEEVKAEAHSDQRRGSPDA